MKLNMNRPMLIDMDCILVDMLPSWLEMYNQRTGENIRIEDITEYDVRKFIKKPEVFSEILYEPGFFLQMKPMPAASIYLSRLIKEGYDIVVLTQAPSESDHGEREKKEWLRHVIPDFNISDIIFAHRKNLVMGSLLFDDKSEHLIEWKKNYPRGITATIEYPYNKETKCDIRFTNQRTAWKEFYEFVKKIST